MTIEVCDGCGQERQGLHAVAGRDYCDACLPSVNAYLEALHAWLTQTAREYRKAVSDLDDQLRVQLPGMRRIPELNDILLKIGDRE